MHSSNRLALATLALAGAAGVAGLSACGRTSDAAPTNVRPASTKPSNFTLTPEQQARIHVITTALTQFYPTVQTTGTVAFDGDLSTSVLSPVSGPVTQLMVEPGRYVTKGTPLATVSSPDFATAIANYRKAVSSATNLQRIAQQDVQLFAVDAIARRDLDQAQTDAAAAVADREAALAQIRSLGIDPAVLNQASGNPNGAVIPAIIRAPISGTVVERLIAPGQLLQAGTTPAFTIANLSTVWVMANVFAADLANVHVGEPVTVHSDVTPQPFTGKVDYIAALVDTSTRATTVRLVVGNRDDFLKRDMFVRVSIQSDHPRSSIFVPASSVMRNDENLPFVFVQAGPTQASGYDRRSVTLGQQVGTMFETLSGLAPGEKVVAEGALFLQFAENQ